MPGSLRRAALPCVRTDGSLRHVVHMDFDITFMLRIAAAALFGGLMGIERDLHARPAGLRTNMMIAIGACLFGILSSEAYKDATGTQDPARIASLVVQGIGFLGAGVLIKGDMKIVGLTTASTIWLAAAVGLACGAGMIPLAAFVTIFSLILLVALNPLSRKLEKIGNKRMKKQGGEVVKEE